MSSPLPWTQIGSPDKSPSSIRRQAKTWGMPRLKPNDRFPSDGRLSLIHNWQKKKPAGSRSRGQPQSTSSSIVPRAPRRAGNRGGPGRGAEPDAVPRPARDAEGLGPGPQRHMGSVSYVMGINHPKYVGMFICSLTQVNIIHIMGELQELTAARRCSQGPTGRASRPKPRCWW